MAVYRLKIYLEDNEDIYREIEIKSGQTFEDLHHIIQEAYKFDKKHAASFFVSDDYWRKGDEITLREEDLDADTKLMSKVKMAKCIENPRQRFIYVFDPQAQWTFCLELMKILNEDPKINYPVIIKSLGNPPKQYKTTQAPKIEAGPENLLAALLKEEEPEDEEIYKTIKTEEHGIDEGDLDHLEGEEGEESQENNEEETEQEDGQDDYGPEDYGSDEDDY